MSCWCSTSWRMKASTRKSWNASDGCWREESNNNEGSNNNDDGVRSRARHDARVRGEDGAQPGGRYGDYRRPCDVAACATAPRLRPAVRPVVLRAPYDRSAAAGGRRMGVGRNEWPTADGGGGSVTHHAARIVGAVHL